MIVSVLERNSRVGLVGHPTLLSVPVCLFLVRLSQKSTGQFVSIKFCLLPLVLKEVLEATASRMNALLRRCHPRQLGTWRGETGFTPKTLLHLVGLPGPVCVVASLLNCVLTLLLQPNLSQK